MLEITPPAKRVSPDYLSKVISNVSTLISDLNCVDLINIPEIIEENRIGMPLYKNMDPCAFAKVIHETTGKEIVVNKVTVHLRSFTSFNSWLKSVIEHYHLHNIVFVGGNSNAINYPGPSVLDANTMAKKLNLVIGNITIPERKYELEKLIAKTESGCSFFTTQIILHTEKIKQILKSYDEVCKNQKIKPATFFLSFAPLSDEHDIYFLKWLGAHVPVDIETRLKINNNIGRASVEIAKELLSDVVSFVLENNISVPISLNAESVSYHNLPFVRDIVMNGKEILGYL